MDDPQIRLEERLAHVIRALEDLSEQMRAQWVRIDTLERRVAWLSAREAERLRDEAEAGDRGPLP